MPPDQSSPPRMILIRGVNWLGDAVMTTPALQRIREKYPEATIKLLTDQKLSGLWQDHRSLDAVLAFKPGENPLRIGRRLRVEGFDTALVLPNSTRSALEIWAAGIPRRLGYGGRWREWFLTEVVSRPLGQTRMHKRTAREVRRLVRRQTGEAKFEHTAKFPADVHNIHHYLTLAAALGSSSAPVPPALQIGASVVSAARAKWLGADNSVLVGLNPSAAYGDAKRWPIENFAAVAKEVAAKCRSCRFVALGGADDRELCEKFKALSGLPVTNLAGLTSLRELMAVLSSCHVLVTNDSGPMHVAAALGTPVVALFGSTSPEFTGPGLPGDTRHVVLHSHSECSPCFRRTCPIDFRCMHRIPVSQVSAAVLHCIEQQGLST